LRARGEAAANGPPEKEMAKKGLEHVLSLIKAVVEAAGDRAAPTLAVHEETQSLILTGTPDQHARVQDTLASLRGEPRPSDQQQNFAARAAHQLREMKTQTEEQVASLRRENERLKAELAEARDEAGKAEDQARKQAIEAERVQVRLEEALTRGSGQTAPKSTDRPDSSDTGSPKSGAK
jgi:predicted RNase H-like nuclease (RuvC/YqgF family)